MKEYAEERAFILENPGEIIEDWTGSLEDLFSETKGFLQSYLDDGLMNIVEYQVEKKEDILGDYTCPAALIYVPSESIKINMRPVERLVAGSAGRVDLYREDVHMQDRMFRILRQRPPKLEERSRKWHIQDLPSGLGALTGELGELAGGLGAPARNLRGYREFNQRSLEQSIEFLVNL